MRKHFVHKYKYSHDTRRKQFRKWAKQGKVTLLEKYSEGFLYEELLDAPISVTGKGHKKRFKID